MLFPPKTEQGHMPYITSRHEFNSSIVNMKFIVDLRSASCLPYEGHTTGGPMHERAVFCFQIKTGRYLSGKDLKCLLPTLTGLRRLCSEIWSLKVSDPGSLILVRQHEFSFSCHSHSGPVLLLERFASEPSPAINLLNTAICVTTGKCESSKCHT